MCDKGGAPGASVLTAVAYVYVLREGVAEVLEVESAVGIESLGEFQAYGVARIAADIHPHPSCHVLAEVDDVLSAVEAAHAYGWHSRHDLHVRGGGADELGHGD